MKVLTIEKTMHAWLRGRRFEVTAHWTPDDPYAMTLSSPHGETWWLSREVVAMALAGGRLDRAEFDAAVTEIVRTAEEDGADHVEVTRYFKNLQPVPVWFDVADWQQLLDDSLAVVPFGDERGYIEWAVEFPEIYQKARGIRGDAS